MQTEKSEPTPRTIGYHEGYAAALQDWLNVPYQEAFRDSRDYVRPKRRWLRARRALWRHLRSAPPMKGPNDE